MKSSLRVRPFALGAIGAFALWMGAHIELHERRAFAQTPAPPASWARSVEVVEDGAVVYQAPRAGARRRGTVREGTRLPLLGRVFGDGCTTGAWVRVGSSAFLCESFVTQSNAPPSGAPMPLVPDGRVLPFDYAFVSIDASRAYAHPSDYFSDNYAEALGSGFGVAITERLELEGTSFVRTRRGLWLEAETLRFVHAPTFAGVSLRAGEVLDHAWVIRDGAVVLEGSKGRTRRRAQRRELVHIVERLARGRARLSDGSVMYTRDLAEARALPLPEGVGERDRWLDVDTTEQVLIAYEGIRPMYVTLVSTGRGGETRTTPKGIFRIWVKLAFSDMDDLEREDVESNYAIENVPWVQYFEGSNGFHAAFWHDDFGQQRSRGCINLSPRDARWLFDFTRPTLPPGWYAVLPTDDDPGTLVRVR